MAAHRRISPGERCRATYMGTVVSCPEADQPLGSPFTLQVQTVLKEVAVTDNKTKHYNTAMSLFACINAVTEGATTPNNSAATAPR